MAGSKYQIKMLGNNKSFDSCNEDHILNCMAKGGVSLAPMVVMVVDVVFVKSKF